MKSEKLLIVAGIVLSLALCMVGAGQIVQPATPSGNQTLRVATTTSLEATGLLAALEGMYENETGTDVQFIAQGTGQALETAQRCDVDLVLVHAPSLEEQFIADGYGINERCFAYNYFIVVGPENDPAEINGTDPVEAFRMIYEAGENGTAGVAFVSRGDNSGTHTREKEIWAEAGYNYTTDIQGSPWYFESGAGMGETLTQANERQAYTLSDEGTFLAFQQDLDIVQLVGAGPALLNRYSAIAVNPAQCPETNIEEANGFINWLITNDTKQFIGEYGVEEYGKPLFVPLYAPNCSEPQFNCTCSEPVPVT